MSRSILEYLRHIETECEFLMQEAGRMDLLAFHKDSVRQRAFIRSIEIIGEAVKALPPEILDRAPHIQWKALAKMRDKLIHQYFGVDLAIVWNLTSEVIPELLKSVRELQRGQD